MSRVVCDIETVASPEVASILDPVKAPAHYKDPFKIKMYEIDKLSERIATASLEPDLCEVVAVGCDVGYGEPEAMTRADMDEKELLEFFWERVGNRPVVGFNILAFDLPVIIRRSQLLNIPCPVMNLDRYRTPHVDLLQRLSFNGAITYRSLKFYTRRFALDVPDDPYVGADMARLVAEGDWEAIRAHVLTDVAATKALAMRLGFLMDVAASA